MGRTQTILALLGPPDETPVPPGVDEDDRECQLASCRTLLGLALALKLPREIQEEAARLVATLELPDADLDAADEVYFRLSEPVMQAMDEFEARKR